LDQRRAAHGNGRIARLRDPRAEAGPPLMSLVPRREDLDSHAARAPEGQHAGARAPRPIRLLRQGEAGALPRAGRDCCRSSTTVVIASLPLKRRGAHLTVVRQHRLLSQAVPSLLVAARRPDVVGLRRLEITSALLKRPTAGARRKCPLAGLAWAAF
jgi:hypothetical protein